MRPVRLEAVARTSVARTRRERRLGRPRRPARPHPQRARQRGVARRSRGLHAGRLLHRAATGAPVRGRSRRGSRSIAHRPAHRSDGGLAATDPECVAAVEDAARLLESLGHTVEVASPAALDEASLLDTFTKIASAAAAAEIAEIGELVGRTLTADDVEAATWVFNELAGTVSSVDYVRALHEGQSWARRVVSWWFADELRPAAHADARGTAADGRRRCGDGRRSAARPLADGAVRREHGAVQCDRPTGDLAADVLVERTGCRSACSSWAHRTGRTCCCAWPRRSKRPVRGPTGCRRSTPEGALRRAMSTVTVAGGQGFYGDTPAATDALARRGRRLPVPRGARRVDARDPAEGPPARRSARLHTRFARRTSRARCRTSPTGAPRSSPTPAGINPAGAARGRGRDREGTRHQRHHDRDRARRRSARPPRRLCEQRATTSRISTRRRRSARCPSPHCSRPRISARARSPTRSRKAPTS